MAAPSATAEQALPLFNVIEWPANTAGGPYYYWTMHLDRCPSIETDETETARAAGVSARALAQWREVRMRINYLRS